MIRGLNHVGISVSSLERSIKFYCDGFGMELVAQSTFDSAKYDGKYEAILGLKGARGRVVVLKFGNIQLELFEFSYPVPKRNDANRPVCDHGITHFCIEVVDIDSEYERLKTVGASFHCAPQKIVGKAAATYGRDPDGNVFELLELYKQSEGNR
jgi:catechol 2,3-dioxygenase-like lactoylglutathione lyase family enzyme